MHYIEFSLDTTVIIIIRYCRRYIALEMVTKMLSAKYLNITLLVHNCWRKSKTNVVLLVLTCHLFNPLTTDDNFRHCNCFRTAEMFLSSRRPVNLQLWCKWFLNCQLCDGFNAFFKAGKPYVWPVKKNFFSKLFGQILNVFEDDSTLVLALGDGLGVLGRCQVDKVLFKIKFGNCKLTF